MDDLTLADAFVFVALSIGGAGHGTGTAGKATTGSLAGLGLGGRLSLGLELG